jgi:hypothetical protein
MESQFLVRLANNVIVSKFLSYHTLHVRSEGGYTHRVVRVDSILYDF